VRPCCVHAVALACERSDARIRALESEIAAGDYAVMRARAELAEAYLRRVLELVARNGGHQWPEDQAMLRGARSVVP
jgi:hypothetical protein